MSYHKSVGLGNFGENLVSDTLAKAGIKNSKNPEKSCRKIMSEWDIEFVFEGKRFTLEAKFDKYEARSGNIAIEYWNVKQGKRSGLLASKSDLWAIVLYEPVTVWVARTSDLRKYFHTVKPFREIACGGDDNAAMKLYRRDELFSDVPFYRLDDKDSDAVALLLNKLLGEINVASS